MGGNNMKVILYMAISVNGMITIGKDDSRWAGSEGIEPPVWDLESHGLPLTDDPV